MVDEYELKPCPFCGGIAITCFSSRIQKWWIFCKKCGANGDLEDSLDKAADAWNLRAEPPNPPLTLAELWEMEGEPVWCEDYQCWGIVKVESKGPWANQPFLCGVYHSDGLAISFEHDIEKRELTLYRRRPEEGNHETD